MSGFIEGVNAVREALLAGVPVDRVMVAHEASGTRVDKVVDAARAAGVRVVRVSAADLKAQSLRGAHQGVAALVRPFTYVSLREVVDRVRTAPSALVLVLDHVVDEGNLGAIARSAEVAGAAALVVPKARSAQVGAGAYKTSAGALAYLPVAREPNVARSLDLLKREGFWVIGASERAATGLWDAPLEGRVALVLGSEGSGLSRVVERSCDVLVRIPVAGRIASLNVAQAATLLAFEWVRRGRDGA